MKDRLGFEVYSSWSQNFYDCIESQTPIVILSIYVQHAADIVADTILPPKTDFFDMCTPTLKLYTMISHGHNFCPIW